MGSRLVMQEAPVGAGPNPSLEQWGKGQFHQRKESAFKWLWNVLQGGHRDRDKADQEVPFPRAKPLENQEEGEIIEKQPKANGREALLGR